MARKQTAVKTVFEVALLLRDMSNGSTHQRTKGEWIAEMLETGLDIDHEVIQQALGMAQIEERSVFVGDSERVRQLAEAVRMLEARLQKLEEKSRNFVDYRQSPSA